MALISKIRRNFWFVLIILGLALASFVIMDILGSRRGGGMFNQTTVGDVNSQKIDYVEFQNTERALFSGGQDPYASRSAVWDYLLGKTIVDKTGEQLGVGVGREELKELLFGANPSPVIQSVFRNPQTGQLDREQLNQIKTAIDAGQELNQEFRFGWAQREKQVQVIQTQEKITNMVSKAMYTPSWLVELNNQFGTETADAAFVKIPFDFISDAEATVTDADYTAFINDKKKAYTNEKETRTIDYAVFDVIPSAADSSKIREQIASLVEDFRTTTNDSLFAANNNGVLANIYQKLDDFTGELKNQIGPLSIGQVVGPFIENNAYVALKLVDKRILPDSVTARHIMKSTQTQTLEQATTTIDSIKNLFENGVSFDSLAIRYSDDTGSGFMGGTLGTFAQGAMIAEINNACFIDSKEGSVYTVRTPSGVHLIQVQKKIYNNQEPKFKAALISAPIIPSDETQQAVFDIANKYLTENRTLAGLEKALEGKSEVTFESSRPMEQNDYLFQNLGGGETSRSIIKWAFTADPGEVSPTVYEYSDNVNYFTKSYVLAGLKSVNQPGLMTLENAKINLEAAVKNKKKAELISSKIKSGTSLEAIASQFNTEADTSMNVSYAQGSAEFAGEPLVVAKVFSQKEGIISKPVSGTSGVYVIQTIAKRPNVAINNMPYAKQAANASARATVTYRLWDALKKTAKVTDNRSRFF